MAGFGTFGHGSSSTLSPLAPPFTAYQSVPKFDSSFQDTGLTGDLGHYSNCGSSDKWLHIHPPSVENNYLASSPDTNFLSLGHNPAFPYAQESVCVSSFPVAEAEPFHPKYPLPLNRSFEASVPHSLCGFACSSEQTVPWSENFVEGKVEPSGSYASSWKEFKGKMPHYRSAVTQGFNTFKGNLGIWEGHYADALARKDNMGSEGISMDHEDEYSMHSSENSGFFSCRTSRSCDLQASCRPQKSSCSHLSSPLVSMTEWSPLTPVTSSWSTVSPLGDALKNESTILESDAFLSQHLSQPTCYGTNTLEIEALKFSWNMQKDVAFPCSKQRKSDVEKSSCQIGNGESRELLEEKSGPKDISFCSSNHTSNNKSNSQNINLHQSNVFSFTSGPGMPLHSSSDNTDPVNHGVDSPCWKGASPSPSLFAAAIQTSEHSAVGLEVTDSPKLCGSTSKEETNDLEVRCSSPSRNPFSVWVTSQPKPVVGNQAEAIGSDKSASGSDQAGSGSAKTNRCIGPSGELKDCTTCHVLSETAKSGSLLETTCSISNVERGVGAVRVPCSQTHECNQSSESGNISPLKLKAETIVETICNLCNLLLSSQFCDLNTLKDEDCKNLQSAMNILSIHLSARKKDDELGFTDGFKKLVDPFQQVDMSNKSENLLRTLKNSSHQHDNHSLSSNFYKFDEFSTDETDCKTSIGTTQVLETHLRENVSCSEEVHPQALIYKNLWIEAEAALCTMKFKLQCAQMQMKIHKLNDLPVKDSEESVGMHESPLAEKVPVLNPLDHMANPNEIQKRTKEIASDDCPLKNLSNTDKKSQADISPDDSVVARFRILKNLIDGASKIHSQNCLVSDNVPPIKTDLQSDCEKMDNSEIRDSTTKMANPNFFEDRSLWSFASENIKNVNLGVDEVSAPLKSMQTMYPNLSATSVFHKPSKTKSHGALVPEYSALDWEHVLKDEFSPRK